MFLLTFMLIELELVMLYWFGASMVCKPEWLVAFFIFRLLDSSVKRILLPSGVVSWLRGAFSQAEKIFSPLNQQARSWGRLALHEGCEEHKS